MNLLMGGENCIHMTNQHKSAFYFIHKSYCKYINQAARRILEYAFGSISDAIFHMARFATFHLSYNPDLICLILKNEISECNPSWPPINQTQLHKTDS